MRELNSKTAPKTVRPERIIQFGEGNFLRAFVDWIISNMNERSDFNGSVVVVQPIEKGMVDVLNRQDGLYHVNLQGLENGQVVNTYRLIDVISRALNPYSHFDEYMKLAEQPEIRFVVSNTTEAGIAFDPACRLDDRPAASYPGKLTQLLYHRFRHFHGDKSKGLIIFPCELIFQNGHHLKRIIRQYIDLWQLGEDFAAWFEGVCHVGGPYRAGLSPQAHRRDSGETAIQRPARRAGRSIPPLGHRGPGKRGTGVSGCGMRSECTLCARRRALPPEKGDLAKRAAYATLPRGLSFRRRHRA